jgi:hypothetical protein
MRATSHAYGIVAGDENGLVASTTNNKRIQISGAAA